jgi:hypothetical protein
MDCCSFESHGPYHFTTPDYAFGLILALVRGASAEEYSFHPQGGLDCARTETVLVIFIANATHVLPSVRLVSSPHRRPPCDVVVVFDLFPNCCIYFKIQA